MRAYSSLLLSCPTHLARLECEMIKPKYEQSLGLLHPPWGNIEDGTVGGTMWISGIGGRGTGDGRGNLRRTSIPSRQ